MFNIFRATIRTTHIHMGTPAFDANRTAKTPAMKGQIYLARVMLNQLLDGLKSIVGEE